MALPLEEARNLASQAVNERAASRARSIIMAKPSPSKNNKGSPVPCLLINDQVLPAPPPPPVAVYVASSLIGADKATQTPEDWGLVLLPEDCNQEGAGTHGRGGGVLRWASCMG